LAIVRIPFLSFYQYNVKKGVPKMIEIGKSMIFIGIVIVIIGVILTFSDKLPFDLGKLPGDIIYKKENITFYFPITTSIIISIVLSLLFIVFGKFFS